MLTNKSIAREPSPRRRTYKKSNKPVKTHMDEVQFKKSGGTEVGITVDPVKIDSLEQFGTPKQVAKRVLDAEVSRL